MKSNSLKIIIWMAVFMGIFLPLAETIRRYKQIPDITKFLHWFDDYILGGLLLLGAWMLRIEKQNAISVMIAAWGIGTGALFLSTLGQLDYFRTDSADAGGTFSVWFVMVVKTLILAYMIIGMLKSIKAAGATVNREP